MTDDRLYIVTFPDGSEWAVPVMAIARNRAQHYADEFGGDLQRSLDEDTLPLFAECKYEIGDWAGNNMDWDDVADQATLYRAPRPLTIEERREAWINGETRIVGGEVRHNNDRC